MKDKTKAILIDILGFALILAAIPIGWIPGPGGIAVVILGLSLLATNHEWAERIMNRLKAEVVNANKKVAEADPTTKWTIDIMSIIFISAAVILLTQFTKSLAITSGVSLVIAGIFMLASNQNRYQKLWTKLRHKHKRK